MTDNIDIGPIHLSKGADGMARLDVGEHVWTWPTRTSPERWQSFGEELATAPSLIDGRFEVVCRGPRGPSQTIRASVEP